MVYAVTSFPEAPFKWRSASRLSALARSCLRHSPASRSIDQAAVAVIDDFPIEEPYIGAVFHLRIPCIGWRYAEVRWVRDRRVGCRLLAATHEAELRSASDRSRILALPFLGFISQISPGEVQITLPEGKNPEKQTMAPVAHQPFRADSHRSKNLLVMLMISAATMLWSVLLELHF